jgi:hypothetical protein
MVGFKGVFIRRCSECKLSWLSNKESGWLERRPRATSADKVKSNQVNSSGGRRDLLLGIFEEWHNPPDMPVWGLKTAVGGNGPGPRSRARCSDAGNMQVLAGFRVAGTRGGRQQRAGSGWRSLWLIRRLRQVGGWTLDSGCGKC